MNWGEVKNTKPILVSGVYRSATTYTASLISSSPVIAGTSSSLKYLRFCLGRYGDLSSKENRKLLIEDCIKRLSVRWNIIGNANEIIRHADIEENPTYASMYDLLMRKLFVLEPHQTDWLEKIALSWTKIPDFLSMFPNGKVIHVIRDPRDVLASYKKHTFESGFAYLDAAMNCNSSMSMASGFKKELDKRVYVVKAEDLFNTKSEEVIKVFQFLNIPFDEEKILNKDFPTFGENWQTNSSFHNNIKHIADKSLSSWSSVLSRAEILFVEMVTQPYLSFFGYESSGIVFDKKILNEFNNFFRDEFIRKRYRKLMINGFGVEGYKTDPIQRELDIVFPERKIT